MFFAGASAFANTSAPVINIWYGPDQIFGNNGIPQAWVNILGNVSDYSGITALSYRLNGGLQVPLFIGPDGKRLQSAGDFNIDIAYSGLSCGANTVVISATDTAGNVATETVNVFYYCNTYWPRTYSINWGTVTNIQDVAQVVDGSWYLEGSSVRPLILGYDRLIAIGDIDPSWNDYEVTVPITLNSPLNSSVPYGPLFGVVTRWQGHFDWDGTQPRWGWWPLGAMGIYDWFPPTNDYRLRIIGNREDSIAEDLSGRHLLVGVPYVFKMRVETAVDKSVYSLKVWEAGTPEPSGWNIRGQGINGGLNYGSLMLITHYSDVSFGNVSICNDSSASMNPGSAEVCNGVDDNCDGQVDEGVQNIYYADADSDAYGNVAVFTQVCTQSVGYVSNSSDCNDGNTSINPGTVEVCNGIDDNCNTHMDEGVQNSYYRDADSDTYGNASVTTQACTEPAGYVSNSSDCNDSDATINPGATETCNLVDDNCNGEVDEGVENTYYADADSDTYGNASVTTQACTQPAGYVSNSSDCNDSNVSINPESSEADNGEDDNCNGQVDEGLATPITDDPPTKLNLFDPANGATGVPTTLTLKWEISTDTEGGPVTYKLHIGTDPGFEDVTPIIVAAASNNNNSAMALRYSIGMFGLFGIIAIGGLSKNGTRPGLLVIPIIMVTGLIVTSCGSGRTGSNNGNPEPGTSKSYESYTVTLQPNTTYYWKVVADKGKEDVAESDTFSFKTGQ